MAWEEEELDDQDQLAYGIARDIEAQWDLHWYEFYSHKELMKMDLSKLELPPEWFKEWEAELNRNNQGIRGIECNLCAVKLHSNLQDAYLRTV